MSCGVFPWVYPVWASLDFLDLGDYFLPHFREVFKYYFLKYFSMAFIFVFFFWDYYDSNAAAFDFVPEVPEVFLISFNFFFLFSLSFFFFYPLSSPSLFLFSASFFLPFALSIFFLSLLLQSINTAILIDSFFFFLLGLC